MNKLFRRISSVLTAAFVALTPAAAPTFAAEEDAPKVVSLRMAAFYDGEGNLVSVKRITGTLSEDETEVLLDMYKTDTARTAKVFAWTANLEPIEGAAKSYPLSDDANSVVILHTNDMHGNLIDDAKNGVIGSDRVAAMKKLDDAILADAGDAVQGVALASQSNGEYVIDIMNAAGYDVMALGNHEFDYGQEQLRKLCELADFPIISANTYLDGQLLCGAEDNNGANIIIEKNGIKVGIFALTTGATKTSTKPENLTGVEFRDEIETAREQVEELDDQGADVIIALTHIGEYEDENSTTCRALAQALQGTELDAIIDGHSHTVIKDEVIGGITVAQTGTASANVGRMKITVAEDGSVTVDGALLSRAFLENVTPDPDVTATVNKYSEELNKTLAQSIGTNVHTLWGGSHNGISISRSGETSMGDLICDAMIAEAEDIMPEEYKGLPIVAIENGGGFRTGIPNGPMTVGSVINCLPFANAVMTRETTPAVLYSALESTLSSVTAQDELYPGFLTSSYSGSFPQIGGMKLVYDPNAESGAKITSLTLSSGVSLDRNDATTKLVVVSNDYIFSKGYFDGCKSIAEGNGLTESVLAYIAELTENGTKPLDRPISDGRIRTAGENAARTYAAHIAIKGENVPAQLTAIVDGSGTATGTVKDGVLELNLTDGPHAIKLYEDQQEVFVNNYSGNGVIDEYDPGTGVLQLGWPTLEYAAE